MLKIVFASLLLANAALFGYHQGYLDHLFADAREPSRLTRQLNPERVRVLGGANANSAILKASDSVSAVRGSDAVVTPPPSVVLAEASPAKTLATDVLSCIEIGNFDSADARRFEARMATLELGKRMVRHGNSDASRHMVYIPIAAGREAAQRQSDELRRLGVADFFVMQDDGNGAKISLGIFKTEESARAHLTNVTQKGVQTARLGTHSVGTNRIAFQLRAIDAPMRDRIEKIRAEFPQREVRACDNA